MKYADFHQITRSVTNLDAYDTKNKILPAAKKLLFDIKGFDYSIRLMGLSVSNPSTADLHEEPKQWQEGDLFVDELL